MEGSEVIPAARSAKPRRGCLGNVFLILVLGIAFVFVFTALAYPWAYFLGGHFHIWPVWRGWGHMHSPGGDYLLFTQVFARTGGRRVSRLRGSAVLCPPRGQSYSLTIYGDFRKQPGLTANVDGLPLYLSISENLNFLQTNRDTRLRFELDGAWQGPDLVMDDRGTLARAFNPDGTLYSGEPHKRPPPGPPIPITLHEGSRSNFDATCSAIHRP
jgi:hypothetical protein